MDDDGYVPRPPMDEDTKRMLWFLGFLAVAIVLAMIFESN
jgi:hypothetical protein